MSRWIVKWLIGFASLAALLWLAVTLHEGDRPARAVVAEDPAPAAQPGLSDNDALSGAELRWCMTEEVRLEATRAHLATLPAVDRYNAMAAEFNFRCGRREYSDEERDDVIAAIADSRPEIAASAIEEIQQLNASVPLSPQRAQELLSLLGYDVGAIDGVYGEQTKAAIRSFQHEKGILVDGLLSQDLLNHLVVALARNRTSRNDRVALAVYVTRANSDVAVSGAEVTITNDQGLQNTSATNAGGRAEFVGVPSGPIDIRVQRDGGGARFQTVITADPRQEVRVIVPEANSLDELRELSNSR